MKRLNAMVGVLACAGFIFAQAGGHKTEQVTSSMVMRGKIVWIDMKSSKILVKGKKEKDTLYVDTSATLISGDKVVKLSDFKKGANVNITWDMVNGKKTASRIDEKVKGGSEKENY